MQEYEETYCPLEEYPAEEVITVKQRIVKKVKPAKAKDGYVAPDPIFDAGGSLRLYSDKRYLHYKLNQYCDLLRRCQTITAERLKTLKLAKKAIFDMNAFNMEYSTSLLNFDNQVISLKHIHMALTEVMRLDLTLDSLRSNLRTYFDVTNDVDPIPLQIAAQYLLLSEHIGLKTMRAASLFVACDISLSNFVTLQQLQYIIKQTDNGIQSHEIVQLLRDLEIDNENQISFLEFSKIIKHLHIRL